MAVGQVGAVDAGAGRAAGVAQTQHTQAPQQAGEARQAGKAEGGGGAHHGQQADAFHASADLEEEREAEEKKKAQEAEAQQQAEEAKKKELEEAIEAKQAELEQAQEAGDQDKVATLTKEIGGLKEELQALLNPQGNQPAPAAGAGGGGGGGDQGGGAPAPVGGGAPMGGGAPAGGNQMAGAPKGSYPPTPADLGGYHPPTPTATGPAPKGQITPNGSGQDAVNLARQYLGRNAIDIKGAMPNFTAAGGQTNNCADFVSSALESTGRVKGHHINVKEFENSLLEQGYVRVPKEQARPGDVWINGSKGHTELVAEAGGNTLIGSNNDRPGHQVISEHKNPNGGYYYQLPDRQ